jgi:hypothetical protein
MEHGSNTSVGLGPGLKGRGGAASGRLGSRSLFACLVKLPYPEVS